MRKLLAGAAPPAIPPVEFYQFTNEINRIGVNINQLAKVANMSGHIMEDDFLKCYGELRDILSEIKEIYLQHRGLKHGDDKDMGC